MDQEIGRGIPGPGLKANKYRQAAYGFLVLNLLYGVIAVIFLRPMGLDVSLVSYIMVFVLLVGVLTALIFRGSRRVVVILTLIYGARSAFSIYSLAFGQPFPAVPYILPCLLATTYLLGRAAWDWP